MTNVRIQDLTPDGAQSALELTAVGELPEQVVDRGLELRQYEGKQWIAVAARLPSIHPRVSEPQDIELSRGLTEHSTFAYAITPRTGESTNVNATMSRFIASIAIPRLQHTKHPLVTGDVFSAQRGKLVDKQIHVSGCSTRWIYHPGCSAGSRRLHGFGVAASKFRLISICAFAALSLLRPALQ